MMNKENKVMNALVNLTVCPRNPGQPCCTKCSYVGSEGCFEHLIGDSMSVLNGSFGTNLSAKASVVSEPNYEAYVSELLREIGMPASVLGYKYTRRAITMVISNDDYIHAVTKVFYPAVAKEFNTTASRAERAIRHAIELAWSRGDLEVLQKYFGNTVCRNKGKPTNSEFIAAIAEHVKLHFSSDSSK